MKMLRFIMFCGLFFTRVVAGVLDCICPEARVFLSRQTMNNRTHLFRPNYIIFRPIKNSLFETQHNSWPTNINPSDASWKANRWSLRTDWTSSTGKWRRMLDVNILPDGYRWSLSYGLAVRSGLQILRSPPIRGFWIAVRRQRHCILFVYEALPGKLPTSLMSF